MIQIIIIAVLVSVIVFISGFLFLFGLPKIEEEEPEEHSQRIKPGTKF